MHRSRNLSDRVGEGVMDLILIIKQYQYVRTEGIFSLTLLLRF